MSFSDVIARGTAARRLNTTLLAVFAALAFGLALVGIYGLTSYTVAQRTRELGIRLALGATPTNVIALLLEESLGRVALGAGVGLAIAPLATHVLAAMLFGVGSIDIDTYIVTATLIVGIALLATYVPARRATHIDPVDALRHE